MGAGVLHKNLLYLDRDAQRFISVRCVSIEMHVSLYNKIYLDMAAGIFHSN
jgi:hypothetical protein